MRTFPLDRVVSLSKAWPLTRPPGTLSRGEDEAPRWRTGRERPSFRDLPPVHRIVDHPELGDCRAKLGRQAALRGVRQALAEARGRLTAGIETAIDPASLARRAAAILRAERPALRPVLNATGILLHTGLGRAPLAAEAVEAVARVASGYCNLEFDLAGGERGRRAEGVADLLRRLTGAEAATVVNNNAGATVLALRALAAGREVVVSRGQLVEIGGSFRLPEVFEVSGARLREVGTTNKTRLSDYANAIGPETAALLRVHASNYRIVGFTEAVPLAELAALAHARGSGRSTTSVPAPWPRACPRASPASRPSPKGWRPGPTWSSSRATSSWEARSAASCSARASPSPASRPTR